MQQMKGFRQKKKTSDALFSLEELKTKQTKTKNKTKQNKTQKQNKNKQTNNQQTNKQTKTKTNITKHYDSGIHSTDLDQHKEMNVN